MTSGVWRGSVPPALPMLALPPYPACPGGAALGYLELYWNAAGEAGQAPTAAGVAAARRSPEAGGRRPTAGKALDLNPGYPCAQAGLK